MRKGEKLKQQCDVCGRWLDKDISNFKKYSRKTKDNIQLVCMAANQLKSDFGMDVVITLCKAIIEYNQS